MFLANGLSGFAAVPAILKHHNTYCSYADTIMPQFFFAVGFAMRLTTLKRLERSGPVAAYSHVVWRVLGLFLLGFVLYHFNGGVKTWAELQALGVSGFLKQAFLGSYIQTLVHIGLTSLWVMPVIARGTKARLLWALGSGVGHLVLSFFWYYQWVTTERNVEGGPFGFLTWSLPTLAGAFAYDVVKANQVVASRLFMSGVVLMLLGYGLTGLDGKFDAPPFLEPWGSKDLLTMSQRSGALTYQTFSAGFSLAVYALFVLACDRAGLTLGVFRTLGTNALAAYILHPIVCEAFEPYFPRDAPGWYVTLAWLGEFGVTYLLLRYMEKNKLFLKL